MQHVSVMVVTYNSANTIIETLTSILEQSIGGRNIELIISDDCSQDNTINAVKDWIKLHRDNFYDIKLLTKEKNEGVSANCNAGWKMCTGTWIKSIGGDDLLLKECLAEFICYVSKNTNCSAVFSYMEWFGNIKKITPEPYNLRFFELSASEQHEYLMFKSFNIAPTSFIKKSALEDVGFADQQYTLIEDLPLWIRFTKNGYKLHFMPRLTVKYRVQSSTSKHQKRYVNKMFLNQLIKIDKNFKISEMRTFGLKLEKLDTITLLYGKKIISWLTNNKISWFSKALDILHFLIRPFYFYRKAYRYYFNNKSRKNS